MALSPKTIKKIQEAVKRFKLYLRFSSVGPHSLTVSELKDLARSGWIGKDANPRTSIADAYMATHLNISDKPGGAIMSTKEGALRFLERMASLYSDKAADQLGTEIIATLESHFLPIIDRKEGGLIYEALKDPKAQGKYIGNILKDKVKNWEKRYALIHQTETSRALNWGAADAIIHNNPEKKPEEIFVYKVGNLPGHGSCKKCTEFWYLEDGITPKLYRLSELLSNGSNIGKKQADFKPTVDPTHPRESHILNELKPGFGFSDGRLEYIDKDHDEYKKQRSK